MFKLLLRRKWLAACLIVLIGVPAAPPGLSHLGIAWIGEAQAQQAEPRRRGFFEMLFGRPRQREARQPTRRTNRTTRQRRQGGSARAPAPVKKVEVAPKEDDARKILVIGDFVAGAVARGLEQTFAEESRLLVVNRSNGNSGLVRNDYYDWVGVLTDMLNEEKPDVVVMVIGSNDRQQIKSGKSRFAPSSEGWEKVYGERIAAISETLKVFDRPFFWVGAPPMRSSSASRSMVYFNSLYKPRVTQAGGHFIDIWNGFTNEDGRYVSSGPDVEGQLRALRTKDGINFTRAGRLKLAFYVEREMKRQTGFGIGAGDVLLTSVPTSQIEIGPDGEQRLVGPVISLSGARPGARDELAGDLDAADAAKKADGVDEETPHHQMVIKGGSLPRVPGRADDFIWPRPPGGSLPVPEPASTN